MDDQEKIASEVTIAESDKGDSIVAAKKPFSKVAAFGFAFTILNSWVVLVTAIGLGLESGGKSALVWGPIYSTIGNLATTLSLTEAFAVYPTAGGQYHWAAILAPPSWVTAFSNLFAFWLAGSSCAYLSTTLITSIALLFDPTFAPTVYQSFGIYTGVIVVASTISLALGPRLNRIIDRGLMLMSIIGVVVIIVTISAMAHPKSTAKSVFGGTNNVTGWDSTGIAWLMGLLQSVFCMVGFDLIFHISEEMPNPRVEAPRVVHMTVVMGGLSSFVVMVCMMFAIDDVNEILETLYALPFAQICMNATGSRAATTIFLLIPALLLANSQRGVVQTSARILMSLGRDNALPFSEKWTVIKYGEPIYGILLSMVIPWACGLVQLGSTAAFTSLLGGSTVLFEVSYAIPILIILFGGRRKLNAEFPDRLSNLGRWGNVANIGALLFIAEGLLIYCFPSERPVTPQNMNYVTVYVAGFMMILGVIWFGWVIKTFKGPSNEMILAISNGTYSTGMTGRLSSS